MYHKRRPYNVPIERIFETRRIFIIRGFAQVLVYKGFQMRYHLFLDSFDSLSKRVYFSKPFGDESLFIRLNSTIGTECRTALLAIKGYH